MNSAPTTPDMETSDRRAVQGTVPPLVLPSRRYTIIYADPPWFYGGELWNRGGAESHYTTQDTDWIARLPVGNIADWNSVCFMWATMPRLPEAIFCLRAWGFEYKTVAFTWVKMNDNTGRPYFGMGSYTRANAELCLLGTRGQIPDRQDKGVSQLIVCPVSDHSRKPDEARERIVKLYGDVPRIELFARTEEGLFDRHEGWDVWGNECRQNAGLHRTSEARHNEKG